MRTAYNDNIDEKECLRLIKSLEEKNLVVLNTYGMEEVPPYYGVYTLV